MRGQGWSVHDPANMPQRSRCTISRLSARRSDLYAARMSAARSPGVAAAAPFVASDFGHATISTCLSAAPGSAEGSEAGRGRGTDLLDAFVKYFERKCHARTNVSLEIAHPFKATLKLYGFAQNAKHGCRGAHPMRWSLGFTSPGSTSAHSGTRLYSSARATSPAPPPPAAQQPPRPLRRSQAHNASPVSSLQH